MPHPPSLSLSLHSLTPLLSVCLSPASLLFCFCGALLPSAPFPLWSSFPGSPLPFCFVLLSNIHIQDFLLFKSEVSVQAAEEKACFLVPAGPALSSGNPSP